MDNYESKEDRAVSDLEDKIKELEADLALKDTWVKHHQESAQLSFNKASDLETQVKDLGTKLNDCAERNMKHKVSVMDLEAKLVEAQAVYNSLIDCAARDTLKINELTSRLQTSFAFGEGLSKEINRLTDLCNSKSEKLAEADKRARDQEDLKVYHCKVKNEHIWKQDEKLKVAVRIIRELQAMDTVCHLDDHFEFLETVKDIK